MTDHWTSELSEFAARVRGFIGDFSGCSRDSYTASEPHPHLTPTLSPPSEGAEREKTGESAVQGLNALISIRGIVSSIGEEGDRTEGMARQEPRPTINMDAEFNRLALELFAMQFAGNAAYRRFCEARKIDPKTVRHWTEIPAVPTAAFKEWELTCLPPELRTAVFHSSGTTGQRPSRHFHGADSLALYECSAGEWFGESFQFSVFSFQSRTRISDERHRQAHLLNLNRVAISAPSSRPSPPMGEKEAERGTADFVLLTPRAEDVPHSSLVHMFEMIRREFGSPQSQFIGEVSGEGDWSIDLRKTELLLREAAARNRPVNVLGTAFNFVHLLDYLEQKEARLELPRGSRVMETGGYKGRSRVLEKEELHGLIGVRLGVPRERIVSEYGMSELSSQAYDCVAGEAPEGRRVFRFPPWARAVVVSPETGREVKEAETGLLRIFDLANVYSVMAIQTEDLGVRHGGGFELLGRAALAEPRGCSLASG